MTTYPRTTARQRLALVGETIPSLFKTRETPEGLEVILNSPGFLWRIDTSGPKVTRYTLLAPDGSEVSANETSTGWLYAALEALAEGRSVSLEDHRR